VGESKSKSSDKSSLRMYKSEHSHDLWLQAQCQAVRITTLGGQKKTLRQGSGQTECKEMFSKRILTNREERAKQYGFVTVECWM
jgi:hypothetical protein